MSAEAGMGRRKPVTIADVLRARARATPDRLFLRTPHDSITYGDAADRVESLAGGLHELGLRPGDRAVLMMANSVEHILVWFALNRSGMVSIPLNTSLRGPFLARAIEQVQASACFADADLVEMALDAVPDLGSRMPLVVRRDSTDESVVPGTSLCDLGSEAHEPQQIAHALDPAVMLFTSGSTGIPKACVLSHHYLVRAGQIHAKYLRFTEDDVLFTPFPLFHIDAATLTVSAALAVGATAALAPRFSASRFWSDVESCGATVFNFMGATANILWKQPATGHDTRHAVRIAWGVPMPSCEPGWAMRFGFPLVEVYGLTDAGLPAYQPLDEPRTPGSCGRIIDEYEVTIQDASGAVLGTGEIGEICIRSDEPGLLMNEYFAMPEQTARALRGGWFHTGDYGCLGDDKRLFFHGRSSEVIRRRGENIAATDIEAAIDAHPSVVESAAVAVPSELGEDDVKVCVVPRPSSGLTEADVRAHCESVLPRHMVPRYVEFLPALPKTATEKIARRELAAHPMTTTTKDFEPAGLHAAATATARSTRA